MKLFVLCSLAYHVAALWPVPATYTNGTSTVWISPNFAVRYQGVGVKSLSTDIPGLTSRAVITDAVTRARNTIFAENFVPWKFHPRNQLNSFEPALYGQKKNYLSLTITQTGTDNSSTFRALPGQVDESYKLTVAADGTASITAASAMGVLYALDTFTQLFYSHSQNIGSVYTPLAPIAISDAPKFAHRGLNMDISRNWFPKKTILHIIDALSYNKFNRLHLHMTDSQSWPLEIPALPDLAKKGAYRQGLTYSPADIREIQSYALYRGIETYIEFDMPGHTTAIGLAYPDLIAAFEKRPWTTYCAEPPCGTLKLNSTAVNNFLKTLFDDVLPRVRPYTSYFHTGGDEVNSQAYLFDETVKSNLTSVIRPHLQALVDRNHAQVRKYGLTPVVWEDMLLTWNLTLGADVVVQTWLSDQSLSQVTAAGHKALFGKYNSWYLDCGYGEWIDAPNGNSFNENYPFLDWCGPFHNWHQIYSEDPLQGLSPAQAALVLGGEVNLWAEQTDPGNVDSMLWPRAAAAAELLWSGRQDAAGQNRSMLDASPRLAEMRERMLARGVLSAPLKPIHCLQHDAEECAWQ